MREWSGCMKQTDFDAANVAAAWANTGSDEGNCEVCHEAGYAAFIATENRTRMFNAISTDRFFMMSFFTPDITDLANATMKINEAAILRVADALPPHTEHPRFNPNDNGGQDALLQFYTAAMAHKTAGTCDPPRLLNLLPRHPLVCPRPRLPRGAEAVSAAAACGPG